MTHQLLDIYYWGILGGNQIIIDPCDGKGALIKVLKERLPSATIKGFDLTKSDNFLTDPIEKYLCDTIVMNTPFRQAGEFIWKAKKCCHDFFCLLPISYLHGQERYESEIFKGLSQVNIFTRYPMLSAEIREDGKYTTGMLGIILINSIVGNQQLIG